MTNPATSICFLRFYASSFKLVNFLIFVMNFFQLSELLRGYFVQIVNLLSFWSFTERYFELLSYGLFETFLVLVEIFILNFGSFKLLLKLKHLLWIDIRRLVSL